jgi:hypothetical protein
MPVLLMSSGKTRQIYASCSIGRAAVSNTAGWGFKSLLACHFPRIQTGDDGSFDRKVRTLPTPDYCT